MHWITRRKIELWIDEKTWNGYTYFNPIECNEFIQNDCQVDETEVFDYFFRLVIEGQLKAKAVLSCSHEGNELTQPSILYEKESSLQDGNVIIDIKDIIDQTVSCVECDHKLIANGSNIDLYFVPTQEYKEILKKERSVPRKKLILS